MVVKDEGVAAEARKTRLELEAFHKPVGKEAVNAAWKELNNSDRFVQFAARVALEHQDPKLWAEKALAEKDPQTATLAILALARVSAPCPEHTPDKKVHGDPALRAKMVGALDRDRLRQADRPAKARPDAHATRSCSTASASRTAGETSGNW